MTNRRFFMLGAGALIAAPAIVRAESLMKLFVPTPEILLPTQYAMETYSLGFAVTLEAFEENLYESLMARYDVTIAGAMLNSMAIG
jgi:hypothetical protein